MKNFVIYNGFGRIVRSGACQEETLTMQAEEGEFVIEGVVNSPFMYVDNGNIVEMPIKPDGHYTFDYDAKAWIFDTNGADIAARQKRDQLLNTGPDRINPMWWAVMSAEQQAAWSVYRTALLDITKQKNYPHHIDWPLKPE